MKNIAIIGKFYTSDGISDGQAVKTNIVTEVIELKQQGELAVLKEHQEALYIMLCEFDRVCKVLKIPYFLFAGTLLGAVRHKGFIPWDDDLDIIMRREDYTRFLDEAPGVIDQEHFFLQREFSDHWPMFFSKLRLNETTCLEKYYPKDPLSHQGVYIDIFPCDNAYAGKLGRLLQFFCSKVVIAKGLYAKGYITDSKLKKLFMGICRLLPKSIFHRIVRGPRDCGDYVHSFLGGASKFSKSVYPVACFEETAQALFEAGRFPIPGQYDTLLKILYGDYMKLPSEEERRCKQHAILVDLKRSYEHYEGYRDGMTFETQTRSIR